MVMASAGQETAHSPHAVQRSRPCSSRLSTCWPRHTGLMGRCCSGYLMVAFLPKKCRIVIIMPFQIAGRYIRSEKVISFLTTTFDLPLRDCIKYLYLIQ